jgi:D-3-phosphoglycerate dehydrogenase
VTLHVPGGKETLNLIGERELKLMKKGSYLLNASRGPVVDVPPVAAALRSGHLAGAAFDVFPVEPPPVKDAKFETPLQGCPNTILTPHIGISFTPSSTVISYGQ